MQTLRQADRPAAGGVLPVKRDKQAETVPAPSQWLPWLVFIVLMGGGLGFYVYRESALAAHRREQIQARQQENAKLGLPPDYPVDFVPLYAGVTLDTAERKDAKSTDGRPMDQWHIHAESDVSKDVIYQYYNQLMLGKGLAQTMYASVPSGYGMTFADDQNEIQFTIEKKLHDKRTQLDIIFSRIQPGAPPAPATKPAPGPPGSVTTKVPMDKPADGANSKGAAPPPAAPPKGTVPPAGK
jgi:hypothetical protein